MLTGCASVPSLPLSESGLAVLLKPDEAPAASGSGTARKPGPGQYEVLGKIYTIMPSSLGYLEIGIASWYGKKFHGRLTAMGEVYDMYGVTAAHKTLPLNTVCRVTNLSNNKSLILRINDRGPYIAGRILDCSYGAAKKLDFIQQGTTDVKIEVIEWGDGKYMQHRKKP